jgi:hypothetical protein
MHDTPQNLPYANEPPQIYEQVPASNFYRRSCFSVDGFLVSCIIPPLMGFGFVALGLYAVHGHTTLVISHSTEHAAVINQAFTALFGIWHFVALVPALSVVQRVRSEEWWRRLLKGISFNRANSVSSNISSTFAHTVEIVLSWSSRCFRSAWIVALAAFVLADIAPGAIHVEIGLEPVPSSFLVPALPANSIYSNYSQPFLHTSDQTHASIDIAPIYYDAVVAASTFVKATPPAYDALVPRPNVSPGQGYRYLTDVYVQVPCNSPKQSLTTKCRYCRVFMNYKCDWYAPVLAEPDSMTGAITSQTLPITAGGVQGLSYAPLFDNSTLVIHFVRTEPSLIPSGCRYISFDRLHRPIYGKPFI